MREPTSEKTSPALYDREAHRYDAVLVVSFGGPEGPDDVRPFLDNVLRGLNLPAPAVELIAKRYEALGGVSPINAHTREFIAALEKELAAHDLELPVYWGNRNWHPFLTDTMTRMRDDGVKRAIAYVTSTFGSYSGCRRYREDLFTSSAAVNRAPAIDKLRYGYNHPGFIAAMTDRVREAFSSIAPSRRAATPLVFTAHSLPVAMADHAPYRAQIAETARLVAGSLGREDFAIAYQSNNASYGNAWLAPRIEDLIVAEAERGMTDLVVAPVGFVCDHMEVVLDLDVDAKALAREHGVNLVRAGTVGYHPAYVAMVRELIEERLRGDGERRALGRYGASHDLCAADCCLSGRPGPAKPALCGAALAGGPSGL